MAKKRIYTKVPVESAKRFAELLKEEGAIETHVRVETDGTATIVAFYGERRQDYNEPEKLRA